MLGEIGQFPSSDVRGIEPLMQAKLDQFANGMRKHIDADPERLKLGYALEDFGANADLMQAERQCQAADAAAGNKNRHVDLILLVEWF
jgi:hypothetical protein